MKIDINRIARFGVVGVTATAIHYGVYYILQNVWNANVSFSIGYLCGLLCNYFLSVKYTFKVKSSGRKFFAFCLSNVVNYIIQLCMFNFFIIIGIPKTLAPFPTYAIAVPINYLLVSYVLTKSKGKFFY